MSKQGSAAKLTKKKRSYNDRIIYIEHEAFTPLAVSANAGMGRESQTFYAKLSGEKLIFR